MLNVEQGVYARGTHTHNLHITNWRAVGWTPLQEADKLAGRYKDEIELND